MSSHRPRNSKRFVDADLMTPLSSATSEFIQLVDNRFSVSTRQWQAHAMQALLEGNNVLVRAGTGSGKSLIFEAMTLSKRDAVVLVVSPIIALMNSQVDSPDIHS